MAESPAAVFRTPNALVNSSGQMDLSSGRSCSLKNSALLVPPRIYVHGIFLISSFPHKGQGCIFYKSPSTLFPATRYPMPVNRNCCSPIIIYLTLNRSRPITERKCYTPRCKAALRKCE